MKNPNGYGTIKKLNGARRRPYGAYITTDYDMPESWPDISFLADALPPELFRDVQQRYESYKLANIQPGRLPTKRIVQPVAAIMISLKKVPLSPM